MKLFFKYNLDKDIENYYIVSKSANPSKRRDMYIMKFGKNLDDESLKKFIRNITKENKINFKEIIKKLEELWEPINDKFFNRMSKIFGINLPVKFINVYLTTSDKCGYSIKNNYFFISAETNCPKGIIMHELFHFYPWYTVVKEPKDRSISKELYYNIKESLTEILNLEFSDLIDCKDDGYPQHKEIRDLVKKYWLSTKNIRKTFYGVLDSIIDSGQ